MYTPFADETAAKAAIDAEIVHVDKLIAVVDKLDIVTVPPDTDETVNNAVNMLNTSVRSSLRSGLYLPGAPPVGPSLANFGLFGAVGANIASIGPALVAGGPAWTAPVAGAPLVFAGKAEVVTYLTDLKAALVDCKSLLDVNPTLPAGTSTNPRIVEKLAGEGSSEEAKRAITVSEICWIIADELARVGAALPAIA